MLAAAMASMVVLACVALMYSMNRTDRMMEVRADQRSDLGRIRTVMERTFTSLLMSDEPQSLYNPEASDTEETGQFSGRFSNRRPAAAPAAAAPAAGAPKGDNTGAGEAESTRTRREPLPPPAPRIMLGVDANSPLTVHFKPSDDVQGIDLAPQRLEVVLHRSPVPQAKVDPLTMPLPPRSTRRTRAETRTDAPEALGGREVQPVSQPTENTSDEGLLEEDPSEGTLPVRAIRGAFELHPQPPRGYRPAGVPTAPVLDPRRGNYESTGLWELWWIPLPPPESEGMPTTRREALYAGLGKPYYIAGDLKYARWTAFFRKSKRADLVSTWSGDLPAYMELQVETSTGLQSNWMFEIDWATGPEIAKRPEPTPEPADRSGAAARAAPVQPTRIDRPASRAGGARPTKPGETPQNQRPPK
jgi:hypothetical protein